MHQRDLVRKAWAEAGLYDTKDAKLQQFLKHIDKTPLDCWPELVELVRTQYPEYLEELVMPLWEVGDKLLRLNLLRNAELSQPAEKNIAQKLVRQLHPKTDLIELRAVIREAPVEVLDQVAKIKSIPEPLQVILDQRRARLKPKKAMKPVS